MTEGVNRADRWCVCGEGYSERRLREAGQCLLFSPVKYLTKGREKCEETNKVGAAFFFNSNIRLQEEESGREDEKRVKTAHVEIDVWRWYRIKILGLSEKTNNKVKIMHDAFIVEMHPEQGQREVSYLHAERAL